jgi:lipid-binding SYLF domain-containing protein
MYGVLCYKSPGNKPATTFKEIPNMNLVIRAGLVLLLMCMPFTQAWADKYQDAIKIFKDAGRSSTFFGNNYGYTVFPTIGKGGIVIGAAHGKGRVYAAGKHVGDASMTQLTLGFQLGGQAYSQIIFFQDKRAFDEFTRGNFEFGAQAEAVAITAGASAGASTTGSSATASGGMNNAITRGSYYRGMAVFTVAKGGLMYEASIGGQKFKYTAK